MSSASKSAGASPASNCSGLPAENLHGRAQASADADLLFKIDGKEPPTVIAAR